jgi:hypothetical protein
MPRCTLRRHRLRPREHLLEDLAAQLAAQVGFDALPVISKLDWVKQGVATGASDRNWKDTDEVRFSAN